MAASPSGQEIGARVSALSTCISSLVTNDDNNGDDDDAGIA